MVTESSLGSKGFKDHVRYYRDFAVFWLLVFSFLLHYMCILLLFLYFNFTVLMTKCTNVCIDMFCFYSKISCRSHVVKSKTPKVKIDDLSDGRETCPVVLINEISEDLPPHLAYISSRNKAEDVYINIDPGFLVCCDCTDFCQVNFFLFFFILISYHLISLSDKNHIFWGWFILG